MISEIDIVYECGDFWVLADRKAYRVMRNNVTHSVEDGAYAKTPDGLSVAKARADYKGKLT